MFGRKVDNSDSQYRFFRDNLFLLLGLAMGHVLLKRGLCFFFNLQQKREKIDLVIGILFSLLLHGVNVIRVFVHLLISFLIAKVTTSKIFFNNSKVKDIGIAMTWIYGIGSLFLNDRFRTIEFSKVLPCLSFLDHQYKGLIPRWDVFFNFTLLRMISFNMDYIDRSFENNKNVVVNGNDQQKEEEILLNDIDRNNYKHPLSEYNFSNYLAYVLYTPLYIAGPIVTFNDYHYQCHHILPSVNKKRITLYALRFAFCVLTMEFLLHFVYVVAASKTHAWDNDTPFQLAMVGLFNLNLIWLKLLIPWRLFRLWALLDGIDPPENMIRCMDNNFSALQFWRAWHRSYNKWVIKYIYIPLGGSSNRILSTLAVFSFVAIWHDIQLKLLLWGWLVVFFLLPEIFVTKLFKPYREKPWYRIVCGVGAVLNIWMMMIANLFGFCLGQDGTKQFLYDLLFTYDGIRFTFLANLGLFIAVQVMFELREQEKRNGIYVKC
ncbi:related to Glycerol uptake protein 1 [Saccharomycodes ludwigii]|uniref:Related to Glycerol uptake protein 1 n=1 Tax=Saccharomycodes ludwigii TaxID=36035 RepID=A0A376B219_9ASCO|nr:related to Glycerol uptake protein 1 [Saccharomycodes ludwigii]